MHPYFHTLYIYLCWIHFPFIFKLGNRVHTIRPNKHNNHLDITSIHTNYYHWSILPLATQECPQKPIWTTLNHQLYILAPQGFIQSPQKTLKLCTIRFIWIDSICALCKGQLTITKLATKAQGQYECCHIAISLLQGDDGPTVNLRMMQESALVYLLNNLQFNNNWSFYSCKIYP